MDAIRGDFNIMIIDLATQIANVCPTSIIGTNLNVLKNLVKTKPETIIDIFVQKVLKYKPQIDDGDESFFMNNSFSSETDGADDKVAKVFEFKNIWKQLNNQNKDIVKQYMKYLCQLALAYLNLIST